MNVLTILAHPSKTSFNHALMQQYIRGAKQNHQIKTLILSDLKFDPILHEGYKTKQPLEPDLIKAQNLIKWADKIVIFTPIWWTTTPAILHVFFDRTFLPNFAYKYTSKLTWKKLLKGKTARIIITSDSPKIYYKLIIGNPIKKFLKGTLQFCGISPIKFTHIGGLKFKTEKQRKKILKKICNIGLKE